MDVLAILFNFHLIPKAANCQMILGSIFQAKYFGRDKSIYIEYGILNKSGGPGAIALGSFWKDSHTGVICI